MGTKTTDEADIATVGGLATTDIVRVARPAVGNFKAAYSQIKALLLGTGGTGDYINNGGAFQRRFFTPPYISGNWYTADIGITLGAGGAFAGANVIKFSVIVLYRDTTITDLAVRVGTAIAASNFQLAIYGFDATTGYPVGAPLASTASMSGAVATQVSSTLTSPVALPAGFYWAAINTDTLGLAFNIVPVASSTAGGFVGSPSLTDINYSSATANGLYTLAQAFGAWPTIAGAPTKVNNSAASQSAVLFYKVQ